MANNPYVNKVEKADGTTIMDITDTTAESGDVLSGEVFYSASGQRSTGSLSLANYVTGPSSATDGNVAVFDGTSGKAIKDSGHTILTDVPANAVFTDTTYSAATQSADGLMSSTDKTKLDGVATGATANTGTVTKVSTGAGLTGGDITTTGTVSIDGMDTSSGSTSKCLTQKGTWASFTNNAGTITGITMNGASKGTSGVVDLGTVITAHQDISGKKNTQTAKTDPTASGTSATFIATISQDAQGVITATKKTVRTMGAATADAAGSTGLVPAPAAGKQAQFLRGDGTWQTPTNTKNTAGSTDTSSKIFLIGATSQAANPQTYSHDTAYVGTDGFLYSGSVKVGTTDYSSQLTAGQSGTTLVDAYLKKFGNVITMSCCLKNSSSSASKTISAYNPLVKFPSSIGLPSQHIMAVARHNDGSTKDLYVSKYYVDGDSTKGQVLFADTLTLPASGWVKFSVTWIV